MCWLLLLWPTTTTAARRWKLVYIYAYYKLTGGNCVFILLQFFLLSSFLYVQLYSNLLLSSCNYYFFHFPWMHFQPRKSCEENWVFREGSQTVFTVNLKIKKRKIIKKKEIERERQHAPTMWIILRIGVKTLRVKMISQHKKIYLRGTARCFQLQFQGFLDAQEQTKSIYKRVGELTIPDGSECDIPHSRDPLEKKRRENPQ